MPDINGTSGNDFITEDSNFSGGTPGAGNDTITGLGGDDVIAGGDGDDLLFGDNTSTIPVLREVYFYELNHFGNSLTLADFDGDGDLDLISSPGGNPGIVEVSERENGTFIR
ncbi:MAG: hypothetical protein ACK54W_21400, partial [Alphaproteobacteria bacterium]